MKNEIVVRAPRSFVIFLFQFFAIVPFGTAFGLILLPFLSKSSNNLIDILILSLIIISLFLIGFSMLYFPQKNRSTIIYDKENRVLKKIKKGKAILSCDLNSAEAFILNNIKQELGVKSELILDKGNGDIVHLYNENSYFGYIQWESFAEKLSNITGLPLKKVAEGIKTKS